MQLLITMFSKTPFRNSLLLCILISLTNYSGAQNFRAGAMAGLIASQVSGDKLAGFDKAGPAAGLFLYRDLNDRWAFFIRMQYAQKGSRTNIRPELDIYHAYLLRIHTAEIPVTIAYKTKKKIIVEAGLAYARILKTYERDEIKEFEEALPFEKNELSIQASLGYLFAPAWMMQVMAQNSITPIRKNGVTSGIYHGQYNSLLAFNLHWFFTLKKTE